MAAAKTQTALPTPPPSHSPSPSPSPSPPLDPVAAVSEELTPLPALKPAGNRPIDFDGQLARALKYHEDVRTGCGGQTWPAGMVLGKHILRYRLNELQDARIDLAEFIENDGGRSLTLCGAQRRKLLLTDQQEMLDLMRHNIELNSLETKATALVLNWGEALPAAVVEQKPNVILAAECVYFEPAFPLLMRTLKDLFALNGDAVVYFCFKKRRRADMQFVKAARKAFVVEEVFDEDRPVFQRQGLFLLAFRRRGEAGKR